MSESETATLDNPTELDNSPDQNDIDHATPTSSNIDHFSYSRATSNLRVTFKQGAEWEYADVPHEIALEWTKAPSPGAYFIAHIKNNYTASRVCTTED